MTRTQPGDWRQRDDAHHQQAADETIISTAQQRPRIIGRMMENATAEDRDTLGRVLRLLGIIREEGK